MQDVSNVVCCSETEKYDSESSSELYSEVEIGKLSGPFVHFKIF